MSGPNFSKEVASNSSKETASNPSKEVAPDPSKGLTSYILMTYILTIEEVQVTNTSRCPD